MRMAALTLPACVLYKQHTSQEAEMDFIRNMQSRDWVVAAVAFFAGALIF